MLKNAMATAFFWHKKVWVGGGGGFVVTLASIYMG